ncbi:MAG: hypothetical protein IJ574_04205 [Bacilli bacterium]|nr:hypothetical protein [Bacilli bacterium]
MNNNYRVKDVLIGLRSKMLEKQNELQELKKYIKCENNNIKDYSFSMIDYNSVETPNLELSCDFTEKNTTRLYKNIFNVSGEDFNYSNVVKNNNNNNGKYIIESCNYNPVITDQNRFDILVDKFFNDEYANNIHSDSNNSDEFYGLTTRYHKAIVNIPGYSFDYRATSDCIVIRKTQNVSTNVRNGYDTQYIYELLEKEFPDYLLTNYQTSIIEQSNLKELELNKFDINNDYFYLLMQETPTKILARAKRSL